MVLYHKINRSDYVQDHVTQKCSSLISCLKPCSDHYIYIAKKCNCLSMFFCVLIFKMVCEQGVKRRQYFFKKKKVNHSSF